ncbi:MAG TPA: hypothetical protein DCM05_18290 [Elusimicrobia bacterium]|nr:hypothetical protein [Elusimicrobiota bacterium]
MLYNEPDPNTGALISTWPVVSWLPQGVENPVVLAARDKIYVIGGDLGPDPAPGVISSAVYFTHVNADHTLGPWVNDREYYLPNPVYMHGGGVWNGRLYIAGGYTSPSGGHTAGVFSAEVAGDAVVSATATYLVPSDIPEGAYTAMASADDLAGNHGSATSYFALDFTPPVSTPTVMGPGRFFGESGKYYVASGGLLQITVEDPVRGVGGGAATGVKERWLKDGEEPYAQTSGPFRLSDGEHALKFYGIDNVGNVELDTKTASVVFDSTAPGTAALALAGATTGSLTLSWLVTGDDGASGRILEGEARIQYGAGAVDFATASAQVILPIVGAEPGTLMSHTLTELATGTVYHIALALRDTAGNWSGTSELGAQTTSYALSADGIAGLASSVPDAGVSVVPAEPALPAYQVAHAQGLDPITPFYELSPSPVAFDPPATISFVFDAAGVDLLGAAIYRFDPAGPSWSTAPILNQTITPLENNKVMIAGTLLSASLYGVFFRTPDIDAPRLALTSPASGARGVLRFFEGSIAVYGSAFDEHLSSWRLESGALLISSGGTQAEGLLGLWDTAGLSGPQTLNLTASDEAGNAAALAADLLIGDPARTLVLGSKKAFNHPHAIAAKAGKLYVADTNADRIALFGEDGAFRGSYGNKTTVEPYFDKPKAVDADEAGNIYVADTQHHRIVKLSAEGGFLFEIGDVQTGKNGKKSFRSGKENGQFKHPSGIALGPGGSIYVSDTGNRRIQVFNAQGVFQRVFTIPDTDQTLDPDAEDKDEFAPIGLDIDAAGNVLIADSKGRRAIVFSQDGQLKQTLSGMFKRPEGIAVSPDGSCILVSDRKLDKVFKFDFKGAQTLEFGEHGEIKDGKPLPSELVFNKPIGLALSDSGTLYVADRNNERIQGFGLPVEQILIASGETGGNTYRAASTGEVAKAVETKFARSTLLKETGGTIIREDKAAVVIPPDALPEDSELTISQTSEDPKRREILTKNRLAEASEAVEFGPDGTKFTTPVTITLPYLAQGVTEDKLKIHYWNPEKKEWEALESTLDKENKLISAKTTHFSLYQVLAPSAGLRAAADPEAAFVFRELYVFPNPARAGAKPTIHLAVGKADQVIIRIYNVAGQQVHEASLDGAPQVIDIQYAYEYAWDGRIPSGVYFYTVEAKKSGQGSIRRTGKMAVVR